MQREHHRTTSRRAGPPAKRRDLQFSGVRSLGIAAVARPNSTLHCAAKQVLLANWLTSGGAAQSFWIEPPRTTPLREL